MATVDFLPPLTEPLDTTWSLCASSYTRNGTKPELATIALVEGTRPLILEQFALTTSPARQPYVEQFANKTGLEHDLIDAALISLYGQMFQRWQQLKTARPGKISGAMAWRQGLITNKQDVPYQTINNCILAIENLDPWMSQGCWYDVVRETHMVGSEPVQDVDAIEAGALIERATEMHVTNIALVGKALDYVCRQQPRDLLQEWVDTLPTVPMSNLLTTWLRTYAKVPDEVPDAYVEDVSRIIPVGMIARILHPGCQYRYVPIFEGEENAGKSELVKALAGEDAYGRSWYVPLSAGLEGKEAHMMLEGALIAELADLSSYTKTDENRMKALVTARTDSFVPKFANKRVDHPRRTIFIATVNPEGDGTYLKGQTGNTRYLPLTVGTIDLQGFAAIRTQLLAEAKAYYLAHPADWWQLDCDDDVHTERERRRQSSVYEDSLADWLGSKTETTWEEIARSYLLLEAKEKWANRALQMEVAKAMKALGWQSHQEWQRGKNTRMWRRC
jgi:putative DNA primase/helicase